MLRTIIFLIFIVIAFIISLPFLLIARLVGGKDKFAPIPKSAGFIAGKIAPLAAKLAGCKYRIEGIENIPDAPLMFAGNHQGAFDALFLLFAFGRVPVIMAKKETSKIPVVNLWMKTIHTIFIDRKDIRQSLQCIKDAEAYLEKGFSFAVFPEGTRSRGPEMGEFKAGVFKTAIKTGVPVVPFAIDGTYKVYEQQKKLKRTKVTLRILEPIAINGTEKTQELAEKVQSEIQKALDDIRNGNE